MTTQTDVLAWLDSLYETNADGALTGRKWPEAQAAHAAVAELVEAASKGAAMKCVGGKPDALYFGPIRADRLRAALANMGGQS